MDNVYIERVHIEGGFLDGFNVHLKQGLNTVIGARGTGKSTFIELIRYCLNIKGHTTESHSKSLSHAKSVLKDGQVFVTLSDGVNSYQYSRNSDGETLPNVSNNIKQPLIFSQTEVENIGLVSSGRLKLIDDFIEGIEEYEIQELSSISLVETYSSEMMKLSSSILDTEDKLISLVSFKVKLADLEAREKALTAVSEQATAKSNELRLLSDSYLTSNRSIQELTIRKQKYSETYASLSALPIMGEQSFNHDSILNLPEINKFEVEATQFIHKAMDKLQEGLSSIDLEINSLQIRMNEINQSGQKLRSEVDHMQQGAGELARIIQSVRKDISELESIQKTNDEKAARIVKLRTSRDLALSKMHELRRDKTEKRLKVCQSLNESLSPRITIHLEECSQLEDYQQVIINALKGSGIKYNELAPMLVEAIPPQILLKITEDNDVDLFTSLLNISSERAYRIINVLKNSIDSISTVKLEDEIVFLLLDGSENKTFNDLSTGQRCTVILPIILEHKDAVLIVDQPEDHIDNAFIVETLIASIKRRKGYGQTIVTTHNANVPVLGEAEEVIHMNSDGTRGYVMSEGTLKDSKIIEAISNVMEGGHEAFSYRAKFYDL